MAKMVSFLASLCETEVISYCFEMPFYKTDFLGKLLSCLYLSCGHPGTKKIYSKTLRCSSSCYTHGLYPISSEEELQIKVSTF